MEERFWRCPKCLKDGRSSVTICSCFVNQAPHQLENKWLHRNLFNHTDSQLPQQELSILQDVRRDYLGERDYSGIPSEILTNKNFDHRNFNSNQEPLYAPFAFKFQQENESVQSNPTSFENYRHSQASSQLFNDSLYKREIPQPSIFSQLSINVNNILREKSAFHVPQRKTNDMASVSGERSFSRNTLHFSDSATANQPSRFNDFRPPNFGEWNQPERKYDAEKEKHSILQILKKPEKAPHQNHTQELSVQPRASAAALTEQFSKERWASAENYPFIPSLTEFGHEKTIEMEQIGGYLFANYTNRDNSAFYNPYLAKEETLSLNRKTSFASLEGTDHQTRSDYLKFTSSGSNTSALSSDLCSKNNWFECDASTNVDKNENLCTSYTNDANKFQGYSGLTISSLDNGNFPGNHNVVKKYEEETRNRESVSRSQNRKAYSEGQNLKTHSQVHSNERRFQCHVCTRSFKRNFHLTEHTRTHTNEKPHKCKFCGRGFSRSSTLSDHIGTHTSEKPHKCKFCQKSFAQRSTLFYHIRTHTGERPYECNICNRRFIQNSNLKQHMRRHKNERPYACGICGKCFNVNSDLKTHSLIHEKGKDASA